MKMNSIWCESFWISDDYAMLSMAHAINLEWRLNDSVCYPAPSLAGHPGVPFYIASWLAMKFSFPISSTGFETFSEIVMHAEDFFLVTQKLAIILGGAGIFLFLLIAVRFVPFSIALLAIIAWMTISSQSLLTILSLSNDSFALLINTAFF
jgi:hypothetical protein